MQNYHRHTSYSEGDSAAMPEEYAKRAVELGHKIISSVEHGWQGYYYEAFELAQKYNLKFVFGTEAYWVYDRQKEYPEIDKETGEQKVNKDGVPKFSKDRSNNHIIILAKTEKGRRAINRILSDANETGYYYKPRIDLNLIFSLPPDDVFITSACVAFWKYKDIDDIVVKLHNYFKNNFMLEIQYHNTEKQKELNKHIKELANKYNIEMIVGLDSHYIYPEQSVERDDILAGRHIEFNNDEVGWYMDYPDDDTVRQRFVEQGVFSADEVQKAMDNTDITLTFDDYDDNPLFKPVVKLPSIYPDKTQEEKNKIYSKLITKLFKEYAEKYVPKERYKEYLDGVAKEVKTYKETGMVDYPLLDYEIIKKGVANGGLITTTGRGSAVGYFTNTLCGFSKVDRFTSPIKLYPERFISKTRILETNSLPDLDMNLGTPEIFEQAQIDVLGRDHAYPMVAFGTLKKKSAFKLYARATNLDFDIANEISKQISKYDDAVKYAEDDEKDDINIYDYVDEKYRIYIENSKKYWGVIDHKNKAPCAYLLHAGSIREEIGLIKCKSESTGKEYITAVIDGAIAEKYKFLKNDLLKVDVVLLIDKIYKRIGIPIHTATEISELVKNDQKVWDLYANGFTIGINQCEKPAAQKKLKRYKPKNISELTAFIAAIRPAFKSMYSKFESRQPFEYGIPAFDKILQTPQFPYSYILYQEQTMNTLNYAGFPLDECYGIIKAIAKKHPEKVKPLKDRFIKGFKNKIIQDDNIAENEASEMSTQVWQIISDSCGYGFNCVSGSTKIKKSGYNGKFVPTVEEMYKIMNDRNYAKNTGHYNLYKKYKTNGYGYALSMFDDNKIYQNKIVTIEPAGVRQTYKITTSTGCSIICTDNHKFPTPFGKKRLDELNVGDQLYCMGETHPKITSTNLTDGNYEKNYPHKGQCGFQEKHNGAFSMFHHIREFNISHKISCEHCDSEFSNDKNFELHHIDQDRTNNCSENLMWLCNSCHKKIHYQNNRNKRYQNGIPTYLDTIISIVPDKIEMTYDVEMMDPAHTFISENGLVVSNSAHAYCMALDSLYCAWLKANHPYEFYEVMLQVYSDKGKKDKVQELKLEMREAFGIEEGSYKFGADNRKFVADKDNHCIYPSLLSIKGLSQGCADDLYNLSKLNTYNDFYELWNAMNNTKSLNCAKIDTLVKMNYFQDFGSIETIEQMINMFNILHGKKSFKKEKMPELYNEYIIKYSEETDKTYRNFNSDKAIHDILSTFPNYKTSLRKMIQYQNEIFGYVTYRNSKLHNVGLVTDVNIKYSPKITMYRLDTGETVIYKLLKRSYQNNPFDTNVFLKFTTKDKYKSKLVDGEWQKTSEIERWIDKYIIKTEEL